MEDEKKKFCLKFSSPSCASLCFSEFSRLRNLCMNPKQKKLTVKPVKGSYKMEKVNCQRGSYKMEIFVPSDGRSTNGDFWTMVCLTKWRSWGHPSPVVIL